MLLDMSINVYISCEHIRHVTLTRHLRKDDTRKLCNRTPNKIASGIKIVVEGGCPTSDRVIHDCDKTINAMWIIYQAKGAIVPGLNDRNGESNSSDGIGRYVGRWARNLNTWSIGWLYHDTETSKVRELAGYQWLR